jgi:hypothetical protein
MSRSLDQDVAGWMLRQHGGEFEFSTPTQIAKGVADTMGVWVDARDVRLLLQDWYGRGRGLVLREKYTTPSGLRKPKYKLLRAP